MSTLRITPRWPLVLAILLATWAPVSQALTYQEALDIAESRASELKARQNTVSAAQAARISAGELPDPKLVMGVDNLPVQGSEAWSTTRNFMTMQRVGVMQEVTNGDKREAAQRLADTRIARADAELEIERLSVKRQTRLAWLKVYFLQQQRALLDQIEAENHLLSTAVTARLASGRGKGGDSLQSRQEFIALEDRRDDLERDLTKARAELARWVGAYIETRTTLKNDDLQEETKVITASMVKIVETGEHFSLLKDGHEQLSVTARVTVDESELKARILAAQHDRAEKQVLQDQLTAQERENAVLEAQLGRSKGSSMNIPPPPPGWWTGGSPQKSNGPPPPPSP